MAIANYQNHDRYEELNEHEAESNICFHFITGPKSHHSASTINNLECKLIFILMLYRNASPINSVRVDLLH